MRDAFPWPYANEESIPRAVSREGPRGVVLACLALCGLFLSGSVTSGSPDPGFRTSPFTRLVSAKDFRFEVRPGMERADLLVVKFREGTAIRLRDGRLRSTDPRVDLRPLDRWLSNHPEVRVTRRFLRDEAALERDRVSGERLSGLRLADLNLYYDFHIPPGPGPEARAAAILAELNGLSLVESAFAEPITSPAFGSDAPRPAVMPALARPAATTPDFTGLQGYLGAAPTGVNAQAVWEFPGGRGATVRIIDIEGAWLWSHEDLPAPFFTGGTPIEDLGWRNHGTAVIGEMAGRLNGYGVTGIASDLQVGGVSIGDMSVAAAIDLAAANVSVGDLFLIELHAPGPNANGQGQYGFVPMEFWQDNFDAIQTAVANGRICIEAAGNGQQDLDDPIYQGFFDRSVRNSGAILVGAGTPATGDAEWYTNYGSRLDLNGWGDSVTTTGYGDLQGGAETQWYTAGFSGTSSASPIVAGAVACLQGMSKAHWGIALNGPLASQILDETGTPWSGIRRIGNRPNLVPARDALLQGIATISGIVRDAETLAPVPDAQVYLVEPSVLVRTNALGTYSVPVRSGTYTLRISEFYHLTDEQSVTVEAGEHLAHNADLTPAPTGYLSGTVLDTHHVFFEDARAQILNTPIPYAMTDPSGNYRIDRVPADTGYDLILGLVPAHGAVWHGVDIRGRRGRLLRRRSLAVGIPDERGPRGRVLGHEALGHKLERELR